MEEGRKEEKEGKRKGREKREGRLQALLLQWQNGPGCSRASTGMRWITRAWIKTSKVSPEHQCWTVHFRIPQLLGQALGSISCSLAPPGPFYRMSWVCSGPRDWNRGDRCSDTTSQGRKQSSCQFRPDTHMGYRGRGESQRWEVSLLSPPHTHTHTSLGSCTLCSFSHQRRKQRGITDRGQMLNQD